MYIANGHRGTAAALLGFAALAISGTAAGASQSAANGSALARSRAVLVCEGMVRTFRSDVFAAATARGAKEATTDVEWQGAALRVASDWLRSGCFNIAL
jgi:hypothetical protein